jgi:hypothetical protein
MKFEVRVPVQTGPHLKRPLGSIVVEHQMYIAVARLGLVDVMRELQEFHDGEEGSSNSLDNRFF